MTSAFRPDVCIRGTGITGRALALLLARERLRVALVSGPATATEQVSASGHGDVRAYALNRASRALLEGLRVWPDMTEATPVAAMQVHGDGGAMAQFTADALGTDALAWIVDVPALERLLDDAVRYQPLIERCDAPVAASLTVVCEGRDSRSRAEFGVQHESHPYGQHAVATRMRCEQPHGGVARQWFLGDASEGDILALLPLDGPLGQTVAVVWSVTPSHAQDLLARDDDAFAQALTTACGHALGAMQCAAPRASWPLLLSRATQWVGDGWALVGDAAHTVHPLAGQGLNLGLADVECLARVLREREYFRGLGERRLLRRYERTRQLDVGAMARVTDGLQRLFSAPGAWPRDLRNRGLAAFDQSGPLKRWLGLQAMGAHPLAGMRPG